MNVSLVVNFKKHDAKKIALEVISALSFKNISIFCTESTAKVLQSEKIQINENIFRICDICIVIGGDGTILHAAKKAAMFNKPVLGINAGRIGYLAALEKDELNLLEAIVYGNYKIEKRIMLDVTIMSANNTETYTVFNDAVISKGSLSRMIDIELFSDQHSLKYRADGLIVATPTGSTAYSLSAGGPVIDPRVEDILLTPICPYTHITKALVIPSSTKMMISVDLSDNKEAFLTVDGEFSTQINNKDKLVINKSNTTVKLISIKSESIFDCLERKIQ